MKKIGVGLIGYKFIGKAHSNAFNQVSKFFQSKVIPSLRAICGRDTKAVKIAMDKYGWESYETN